MADVTWTEEGQSAPPKKKIPTWVWFCGGGCLAMLVLAIVAGGLMFNFVKKGVDPEVQWPRLAKILPFDERPQNLEIVFGNQIGIEQYVLRDETRALQLQIQHHKGPDGGEARDQIFGSDKPAFPENMGVMKFADMQRGVVEVQGRELRVLRMRMELAGFVKSFVPKEGQGAFGSMMMVDATQADDDGMLFLQIMREASAEPITDDDLREILKPFHVGSNR
jgi:hypothetical protein